jgi:hypothetical protein
MVDIIVYQSHHVVGRALAVAVDAGGGRGGMHLVAMWQQNNEQDGGSGGRRQGDAPDNMSRLAMLLFAPLRVGGMYLFY